MARVFVSYSRVDRSFADQLTQHLRRVYGYQNIWLDEVLHGGQLWWEEILNQIADCDIFIYLLTRDWIESPYCRAEYEEALRLQKLILPVVIRARTVAPQDMLRYQFVDMSAGLTVDSMTDLQAAITQLSAQIPPSPLPPRAPTPTDVPAMTGAIAIGGASASERARRRALMLAALAVVALLVIALVILLSLNGGGSTPPDASRTPTGEPATRVAAVSTEVEATSTPTVQSTATPDTSATQAANDATTTAQALAALDADATATESAQATGSAEAMDVQATETADAAHAATSTSQARDADATAIEAANAAVTAEAMDTQATETAQAARDATATAQTLDDSATATAAANATATGQAQIAQTTREAQATRDATATQQALDAQAAAQTQTAEADAAQATRDAQATAQDLADTTATWQARNVQATQAALGTAAAQIVIQQTSEVRLERVLGTSEALAPTPTPQITATPTVVSAPDPACAVTLEAEGAELRGYALPSHASFSITLADGVQGTLVARLSDPPYRGWRRVQLIGVVGEPLVWVDEMVSLRAAGRCNVAQTSLEFVYIERFVALLTPPPMPVTYYSDSFTNLSPAWAFTIDGVSAPLEINANERGLQISAGRRPGVLAYANADPMGDVLAAMNFRQSSLADNSYVGLQIGVTPDESAYYEARLTAQCVLEVWRVDAGNAARVRSTRPLTSCANDASADQLLEVSYVDDHFQVSVNREPKVLVLTLDRLTERGEVRTVIYETNLALDYVVVAGTE